MLGSVLAQLVRSETSLKWPRALLQISPSALGIQFGSRARRYNISRARRSVNLIIKKLLKASWIGSYVVSADQDWRQDFWWAATELRADFERDAHFGRCFEHVADSAWFGSDYDCGSAGDASDSEKLRAERNLSRLLAARLLADALRAAFYFALAFVVWIYWNFVTEIGELTFDGASYVAEAQ